MYLLQTKEFHLAEAEIAKGFKLYDGPFVKELDTALASFNVRRQAYYSGTFVGNHAHRTRSSNTEGEIIKQMIIGGEHETLM